MSQMVILESGYVWYKQRSYPDTIGAKFTQRAKPQVATTSYTIMLDARGVVKGWNIPPPPRWTYIYMYSIVIIVLLVIFYWCCAYLCCFVVLIFLYRMHKTCFNKRACVWAAVLSQNHVMLVRKHIWPLYWLLNL